MEDLHHQFAIATPTQKVELLSEALNAGNIGIDLLIEALQDETLAIRATAYKLLQSVSAEKAQRAIANGVLLNPGDHIYSIYKSAISFNDEFYTLETEVMGEAPSFEESLKNTSWQELGFESYEEFYVGQLQLYEWIPQRVSRHILKSTADTIAESLHQQQLLEKDIWEFDAFGGWRNIYSGRDNLQAWCVANQVAFEDDLEIIIERLKSTENFSLLSQLWKDAVGIFAFVREEIIQEGMYLKEE